MMVRQIKGKFYVTSSSTKGFHVLDKNLSCSCKGHFAHGHCKHQKAVEEYINSGATVDIARTPLFKEKWN